MMSMLPEVGDRLVDMKKSIDFLEKTGKLVRVKSEVDPKYDLAGIAKKYEGKQCILFEKVKGSAFPVFMGLLWDRGTIASLFNVPKEEVPVLFREALEAWRKDKTALASRILEKGPANEVIITKDINLYDLPVPVHALKDGGQYFDSTVVLANNPESGIPNISIHRMLITGKDRLVIAVGAPTQLKKYLAIMDKKGKPLQVTLNNGVGIAPWIASNINGVGAGKATIASHVVGRPIDFIKSQKVSVPAFADAQFVIEAEFFPPEVTEPEGPFGEVAGYYGEVRNHRVMQVKAITHQKNPIFHSLLIGKEYWNGVAKEAMIFAEVKQKVPDLRAVHMPPGACSVFGAVIQLEKSKEGVQNEAILETFKAIPVLQWVIAVDTDVDLYDPVDVEWAFTTRFNAKKGFIMLKDQNAVYGRTNPNPIVDEAGLVTKVGIDATVPYPRTNRFERVQFKEVNLEDYVIKE